MHTSYSDDCQAPMEQMISKAIAQGFEEIALTDHVDFVGAYSCMINYNEYIQQLSTLKEKYSGKIRITLGVEIGFAQELPKVAEDLASKYPFEFVIASTHALLGRDMSGEREELFFSRTKREAYELYFQHMLEGVRSMQSFSVVGHLDAVERYGYYNDNRAYYHEYSELIDALLREIILMGKGIELNTSGFRYGLGHPHPHIDILRRYKELGGEIITLGSDAHRPGDIGANFYEAEEILKEAGFKAITIFREKKPKWVNL